MPRLTSPKKEMVAQLKAQAYLDPVNAPSDTQIVQKAYGYSKETAHAIAHRVMASDGVQSRLKELLLGKISDEKVVLKSKQMLDAKKSILDREGNVIAKVPDNAIQMDMLKVILKIKGVLQEAGNTFVDARSVEYGLNISDSPISSKVLSILDNINSKLSLLPTEDSSNVL